MSKFFMYGTDYQEMEQLMILVPNFIPRRSGVIVVKKVEKRKETLDKLNRGESIEDRVGNHLGIWNCRRRLKLFYADEEELNIISSPQEGTQVYMKIPVT